MLFIFVVKIIPLLTLCPFDMPPSFSEFFIDFWHDEMLRAQFCIFSSLLLELVISLRTSGFLFSVIVFRDHCLLAIGMSLFLHLLRGQGEELYIWMLIHVPIHMYHCFCICLYYILSSMYVKFISISVTLRQDFTYLQLLSDSEKPGFSHPFTYLFHPSIHVKQVQHCQPVPQWEINLPTKVQCLWTDPFKFPCKALFAKVP